MKIERELTDQAILAEIGTRLCRLRLDRNWTQSDVAEQAGVGLRTLQRLETGQSGAQLSSFIRILRVLGLVERFELLIAEPKPSPVEQLKLQSKRRKRASSSGVRVGSRPEADRIAERESTWTWGE